MQNHQNSIVYFHNFSFIGPNEIYDPYKTYSHQQKQIQKKPWIHELLQKEVTRPTTTYVDAEYQRPSAIDIETTTHFVPTIPSTSSRTIDDFFAPPHKHQASKSMATPMYLIIEGHSKVKTYGQSDDNAGKPVAKIVPVDSSAKNPVVKHVIAENDRGVQIEVKHLHRRSKGEIKDDGKNMIRDNSNNTMNSLLSLLDTTFGDYFMDDDSVKVQHENATKKNDKVYGIDNQTVEGAKM